ncbi:MAG: CRISPR-associated endonuclease Cas2 [Puniceicoccales bacterium]|nr:CRISPR-associated endonuclease Cas2 [Puniceicoccales bacterium]
MPSCPATPCAGLFPAIHTSAALAAAWKHARAKNGAAGADGVGIRDFSGAFPRAPLDLPENIAEGRHSPAPVLYTLSDARPAEGREALCEDASPPPPKDWWETAFANRPNASELAGHPRARPLMLILVAYDIACPRRLARISRVCKDYGVRVQKSLFECHLDAARFNDLWQRLNMLVEASEDSLVAYPINAADSAKTRAIGLMHRSNPVTSYIF